MVCYYCFWIQEPIIVVDPSVIPMTDDELEAQQQQQQKQQQQQQK